MEASPKGPGVFISETQASPHTVIPATTNVTAFLGAFPQGPTDEARYVSSWAEFAGLFGDPGATSSLAAYAVWQFFGGGGSEAWIVRLVAPDAGATEARDGAWDGAALARAIDRELTEDLRLDRIAPALFNLLCMPDVALLSAAQQAGAFATAYAFCAARQAVLLVDPPPPSKDIAFGGIQAQLEIEALGAPGGAGLKTLTSTWAADLLSPEHPWAATYYPWVQITDPVSQMPIYVAPSGTIAGVYATTDTARGVWAAPAGIGASLPGVTALADPTIDDRLNGELNALGINCLRTFPVYGHVVWGARTLAGGDLAASDFKYVPVRRLAALVEQSLRQSLRWAAFEPNAEPLWSSIRLAAGSFMASLFAQGAFAGSTPREAYVVACDASTTPAADQRAGIVNVIVGFAPMRPAEFVTTRISLAAAPAPS